MPRSKPLPLGARIGNWTVLREGGLRANRALTYECACLCGSKRVLKAAAIRRNERISCGCMGNGHRLRPYESLYNSFRYYARQRGISVCITFEQFADLTKVMSCHYCGASIYWRIYDDKPRDGKPRRHSYNLDRKDSSLPYVIDNVVVCCKRCNAAKSNAFTYDEWVRVGEVIQTFDKGGENA